MNRGILHLIPSPLTGATIHQISPQALEACYALEHFVVERAKTARAVLKSMRHPIPMPQLKLLEIDGDQSGSVLLEALEWLNSGISVGLMSEAGLPCIADPGSKLVAMAHQRGLEVRPYAGPNAMLMALMASGFDGQQFQFHGYLPAKKESLRQALIQMVQWIRKTRQPQIFMETPYRNKQVIEALCHHVPADLSLCIASMIGSEDQRIQTMMVRQWTPSMLALHFDRPAIFILGLLA